MRALSLFLLLTACSMSTIYGQSSEENLEAIRAYLRISDHLSTSGQITYDQIADLKAAGFEVVVNLAVADAERNGEEGFRVTEAGLTYIHIPVSWREPSLRDLELFYDVMEANKDRRVYVHCFANMRVSVFVYLYRTMVLGLDEAEARVDLMKIWDPADQEQWSAFIEQARSQQGR